MVQVKSVGLFFLRGVAIALIATSAQAETLMVDVIGVRSGSGEVQLDLYNAERKHVARKRVQARPGRVQVEFGNLSPGTYGVYVYHDENGNKKLDTGGLLRMPTEGYAFSNNAPARFGPPSMKDLAVTLAPGAIARTPATMNYRR